MEKTKSIPVTDIFQAVIEKAGGERPKKPFIWDGTYHRQNR